MILSSTEKKVCTKCHSLNCIKCNIYHGPYFPSIQHNNQIEKWQINFQDPPPSSLPFPKHMAQHVISLTSQVMLLTISIHYKSSPVCISSASRHSVHVLFAVRRSSLCQYERGYPPQSLRQATGRCQWTQTNTHHWPAIIFIKI